jgi:hypothetical protein
MGDDIKDNTNEIKEAHVDAQIDINKDMTKDLPKEEKKSTYLLVYAGTREDYDKTQDILKKQYPQAEFSDDSDDIHEYRYSAIIKDITTEEAQIFMCKEGFAPLELGFNLLMMRDIEKAKEIIRKAGIEIPGDKEKV